MLLTSLVILYFLVNTTLNNRIDDDLIEDVEEVRNLYSIGGISEIKRKINNEASTSNANQEFIRILDNHGSELFASNLSSWKGIYTIETILSRTVISHPEPLLETVKFASQEHKTRIIYALVSTDKIMQMGESYEDKDNLMELLFLVFIPVFIIIIPIASFVGWRVARHASQGIEEVSNAAAELEKGDFNRRVAMHSQHEEVQTLVDTFNNMGERIRTLITEMREMIDNIAHDLRSPLGRIRAISESALSGSDSIVEYKTAAADTLTECDRLINMINTTLDIAEAEAGISNTSKEDVNLSQLVEDVCELFEPVAAEKNIVFTFKSKLNRHIKGNKQSLQRMLANLLDNAVKYTPSNGSIDVQLNNNPDAYRIIIKDTGAGVQASDHKRIFDRFFRCDSSRGHKGNGLGLSYAIAVARSHGGDILLDSIPGKGSTFTVQLPSSS
jgi:signal transduction histidine kinase